MEGEVFFPNPDVIGAAHIKEYENLYQQSIKDPHAFWKKIAEKLYWSKKWDRVLDDSNPPFYKWFLGGQTNIVYNALGRHLKTYRKNKEALIWEGEAGDVRTFSYYSLNREVCRFATALNGGEKGRHCDHLYAAHP